MRRRPIGRFATILTVGSLVMGCESATEPMGEAPIDLGAALADYEAVDGVLSSPAFAGFKALVDRGPFAGIVGPVAAGPSRASIISGFHRGATFVFEPEVDQYRVDPDREGAPSTGVRFILYELDATGRPISDEEIGYADLVDEGDGSAEDVVLHMTVVEDSVTRLDYTIRATGTESGGSVAVEGFLQGSARLDFNVRAEGTQVGSPSRSYFRGDPRAAPPVRGAPGRLSPSCAGVS